MNNELVKQEDLSIVQEEWYQSLLEEISVIRGECYKQAQEITIQWRWMIGKVIVDEKRVYGKISKLARDTGISTRSINDYMAFYKKYKAEEWDTAYKKIPPKKYTALMRDIRGKEEECKHENCERSIVWKCLDCGRKFNQDPRIK